MKLISWNVNGLRACIQKGFLEQFDRFDADFFCLQEIKLSEGQLELDLPGYHQYWCYADKKGYSGTAIFTKHKPISVRYGLGAAELDGEGRLITLEYPEFFLVTCYTPNAQRGLARIDHRLRWDEAFRQYLKTLDLEKPVILCGDLNVAHQEIDLKNPNSNRGNAGFSDQERSSFQSTLDLGFTDTFRHLHPTKTGAYSWWSYMFKARENNAGWRIDYFLVSDRLKDAIIRADIHSDVLGSDHCPVSLDISLICNGGIWSPLSEGSARQSYPEPKKEQEPKASAPNAKALVAFALAVMLLLSAVLLWPAPQPNDPIVELNHYFRVHIHNIFTQPITYVSQLYSNQSLSGYLTDGTDVFYCITAPSQEQLSQYNTWVHVEALEPLLERIDTSASLDFLMPDGISYQVELLQYYTDSDYLQFGGWLLFFNLPESVNCTLTVASGDFSCSETVYLPYYEASPQTIPEIPLNSLSVTTFATPLSWRFASDENSNYRIYDPEAVFTNNPFTVYSDQLPGTGDFANCNSFFYVELSKDAQEALSGIDLSIKLSHDVCFTKVYRDALLTDFAGWLIYGNLDNTDKLHVTLCPTSVPDYTIVHSLITSEPYMSWSDAKQLSTEELLRYVLTHKGIIRNLSSEITGDLSDTYPAFAVLCQREDALETLMSGDVDDISNSKNIISILLSRFFRHSMDPVQEAAYLTGNYPNCETDITRVPDDTDPQVYDSMNTTTLLTRMLSISGLDAVLDQCSTPEAAYQIVLLHMPYYSHLRAFLARDNAAETVHSAYYVAGDPSYIDSLEQYIDYILLRLHNCDVSTQTLLDTFADYADSLPDVYFDANLTALLEREDAAELLMNADPATSKWPASMTEALLSVYTWPMTPELAAMYITDLYPSHSLYQSFGKIYTSHLSSGEDVDFASLTTYELLNNISNLSILNGFFTRAYSFQDPTAVMYHIHQLLLPYSDYLRELATRQDAISYMRIMNLYAPEIKLLPGKLLTVYENYPEVWSGDRPALNTIMLLDVSTWQVSDIGSSSVLSGDISVYIPSDYFSEHLFADAEFSYIATVPQTWTSKYTFEESVLQVRINYRGLLPEKNYFDYVPCYTDPEMTKQCGWLIYGALGEKSGITLTITDDEGNEIFRDFKTIIDSAIATAPEYAYEITLE